MNELSNTSREMSDHRMVITACCRVGEVRQNNEDMILVRNRYIRDDRYDTEINLDKCDKALLAIADGMGGYQGGEVASEEVLSSLHFYVSDLPKGLSCEAFNAAMADWLDSINNVINAKGKENESLQNMGTTLVAIVIYDNRIFWMSCGDSRLYRLRDGKLLQITTDHSLNTLYGEAKHSNVLTNCIGAGCTSSYLDINEFTEDVRYGDIYLLCSDGLSDMVNNDTIAHLLSSGCSAEKLCLAAEAAGGFDNVSACVIRVQ